MAKRRPYSVEFATLMGAPSAAKVQGSTVSQGAYCRCGAWRGQLGLESDIDSYVRHIVEIFREVRRVMRDDACCFLNIGDSYANDTKWGGSTGGKHVEGLHGETGIGRQKVTTGLKPKDLCLIPFRVALALQADGWWIRSDIVWNKPSTMPESVNDRCTRSHEYIFHLAKSLRYYWDATAIREDAAESSLDRIGQPNFANQTGGPKDYRNGVNPSRSMRQTLENFAQNPGRNKRDVWTLSTTPNRWALCKACRYVSDRWPECRLCGGVESSKPAGDSLSPGLMRSPGPNSRIHRSFDPGHPSELDGKQRLDDPEVEAPPCARCGGKRVCPQCGGSDVTGHFASFPESLPTLCMLAGTSSKGCCSKCGSPWERVVGGRGYDPVTVDAGLRLVDAGLRLVDDSRNDNRRKLDGKSQEWREAVASRETTGWRQTCDCEGASVVPCLVMDPFLGSGTSAEVAERLGRKWIGLEMSPDYIAICQKRLSQRGLFSRVAAEAEPEEMAVETETVEVSTSTELEISVVSNGYRQGAFDFMARDLPVANEAAMMPKQMNLSSKTEEDASNG